MDKGLQQKLCRKKYCLIYIMSSKPIPVIRVSKEWFCSRSLAGIVVLNAARVMDACLL